MRNLSRCIYFIIAFWATFAIMDGSRILHAAIIMFRFEGDVRYIGNPQFLDGSVHVGSKISGFFNFDSASDDKKPLIDNWGQYLSTSMFGATVGNYKFQLSNAGIGQIQVTSQIGGSKIGEVIDIYEFNGFGEFANIEPSIKPFFIGLGYTIQDPLSTDALPSSPPEFLSGAFSNIALLSFNSLGTGDVDITADLTFIEAVVPEPSSIALWALLALTTAVYRRKATDS